MNDFADWLAAHRPTAVYRFYNAHKQLLYVGITSNLGARFGHHQRNAAWWLQQDTVRIAWRDTRAEAVAEEAAAIREEGPLYNIAGTRVRAARTERIVVAPEVREAVAREVRGELARYRTSTREVAELLGMSCHSVRERLFGRSPFRPEELDAIAEHLGIPVSVFTQARIRAVSA